MASNISLWQITSAAFRHYLCVRLCSHGLEVCCEMSWFLQLATEPVMYNVVMLIYIANSGRKYVEYMWLLQRTASLVLLPHNTEERARGPFAAQLVQPETQCPCLSVAAAVHYPLHVALVTRRCSQAPTPTGDTSVLTANL